MELKKSLIHEDPRVPSAAERTCGYNKARDDTKNCADPRIRGDRAGSC
jgi:hypothetical protein